MDRRWTWQATDGLDGPAGQCITLRREGSIGAAQGLDRSGRKPLVVAHDGSGDALDAFIRPRRPGALHRLYRGEAVAGIRSVAAAITAWCGGAARPAPKGIAALGWMSGTWETGGGGSRTEEQWSEPSGGMMMGFSRTGAVGGGGTFRFLRIAQDEYGFVTYWVSSGGRSAIGFPLVGMTSSSATFENPEQGSPRRISFARDGARMIVKTAGPDGANAQSQVYRRRAN